MRITPEANRNRPVKSETNRRRSGFTALHIEPDSRCEAFIVLREPRVAKMQRCEAPHGRKGGNGRKGASAAARNNPAPLLHTGLRRACFQF